MKTEIRNIKWYNKKTSELNKISFLIIDLCCELLQTVKKCQLKDFIFLLG